MKTNFEHYKDELIIDMLCHSSVMCDFKKKHILNVNECRDISCEYCKQYTEEWIEKEYQPEPEIDWSKVPCDTIVYVSNDLNDDGTIKNKKLRHFAKQSCNGNNGFNTFNNGMSSKETSYVTNWNYCELALPEDIEKYKK